MSDIPEAFMKAALTIAATSPTLASDIARALMAADKAATKRERERCAKVASDSYARWRDQGDKCEVECDATACQDIEAEILKGAE